jgi:NADP-dependent 3-hydroxy acid dehydrogenase YdfG
MATALITGASSGSGMSTVLEVSRAGHTVIAAMRKPRGLARPDQTFGNVHVRRVELMQVRDRSVISVSLW